MWTKNKWHLFCNVFNITYALHVYLLHTILWTDLHLQCYMQFVADDCKRDNVRMHHEMLPADSQL